MRTFVFLSEKGASFSVAYKLFSEENRVVFLCPTAPKVGSGFLEVPKDGTVQAIEPLIDKADAIIFDAPYPGSSAMASTFRERGIPVFGTSAFEEALYTSKSYRIKFLKAHGLNVASGYILEPDSKNFIALRVALLFSGGRVVQVLYSFDATGLMNDNVGLPVTMGSICRVGKVGDRLFSEGISAVTRGLEKEAFSGQISVNFVVTKHRLFAYSADVGFFQPHILSVLDGRKVSLENMFMALALNNLSKFPVRPEWNIAVRVAVAPFPYPVNGKYPEEFKIAGLNEGNLKHLWFEDVYFRNGYSCARVSGSLCFVTARGAHVREARRRAYRTVSALEVPYPFYRTDVGTRANWEYPLLEEWGWLKHT